MASHTTLTGSAGQYLVMAELLRRGYIAALAPEGVPMTDILVTDLKGSRLCSIQVKTRRDKGSDGGWHMSAKHEETSDAKFFYCFVDLGKEGLGVPKYWIVRSDIVAKTLKATHKAWLDKEGKKGQKHKDGPMRRFQPDYKDKYPKNKNPYPLGWLDEYKDAWGTLKLDVAPTMNE
ncbi:MAG: hypothetical protein ACK4GK_16950 [Ferrovibrio sp.]